jgi:hypothetical protein
VHRQDVDQDVAVALQNQDVVRLVARQSSVRDRDAVRLVDYQFVVVVVRHLMANQKDCFQVVVHRDVDRLVADLPVVNHLVVNHLVVADLVEYQMDYFLDAASVVAALVELEFEELVVKVVVLRQEFVELKV